MVHVHVDVIRQISTVVNDRHSVPTQESWMIVFEEAAEMPLKRTKKTQQSEDVSYMAGLLPIRLKTQNNQ